MALKIYIVYYSMYGHVERLAEEIKKELIQLQQWKQPYGSTCPLLLGIIESGKHQESFVALSVPETLPKEVLIKMNVPPRSEVPIIQPRQLADADALILGFPTRYGMMAAQFKAFMDATGGLWKEQALAGKPAGIFYSTGSQGGGQETTPLTAITQLVHHGLVYVPIGYTFGAGMFEMNEVKGGGPYGAGTFAGDGTRQPTALELQQAFHQGRYTALIAKRMNGAC